ncbi:uncharacterized protein TNCT_221021 [Trichonephila clavata]|uniref:Uncharacterized protein n=1 Tax=Trichonephila clavata TaxID=2740835 RepID=A0A8X6FVV8_TRICU|nr:uncharacterized protein TNCT_221021 [Trichonephila clavata]
MYLSAALIKNHGYARISPHDSVVCFNKIFSFLSYRGEACYRMVSLLKGSCQKNFIKRYFRELWFLSCGENEEEYFLTDDHVPALRAVVHLTTEEKIVLGTVQRLTSENESEKQ